jgi:adenine deaminase
MKMLNAVILKEEWQELPIRDGSVSVHHDEQLLYAALLDHEGKWLTTGVLKGFGKIDALASTYTVSPGMIVLGRDREQMAEAVDRVKKTGGGICLMEKGEPLFELPLPFLGGMSYQPMDVLIQETKHLVALLRERGYTHKDPLYTLLFLSATHLPALRLTAEGLLSIKTNKIVVPAKRLK